MKNVLSAVAFACCSLSLSAFAQSGAESGLTVYGKSVGGCSDTDQRQGRCQNNQVSHVVCMTYKNDDWDIKTCDLRADALFEESLPTGFTKEVSDYRQEKLFPQQQHRVCFSFLKDQYNLWKLKKVGKPTVSCVSSGGGLPKDKCDVTQQRKCDKIDIDTQTQCSPYDWTCN